MAKCPTCARQIHGRAWLCNPCFGLLPPDFVAQALATITTELAARAQTMCSYPNCIEVRALGRSKCAKHLEAQRAYSAAIGKLPLCPLCGRVNDAEKTRCHPALPRQAQRATAEEQGGMSLRQRLIAAPSPAKAPDIVRDTPRPSGQAPG